MYQLKSWRVPRPHVPFGPGEKHPAIPATKFFDNLSFIGNESVGCFLLETSDGLILLDCMEPEHYPVIEHGIRELGFDPSELKHILITHGHFDHFGNAGYFQKKYGTQLWMSEIDEKYARDPNPFPPRAFPGYPLMPFEMDGYLTDGGIFRLGHTEIETYHTPGHTPGCMSFIFKVYDEGRSHVCALWGGTGPRRSLEENESLLSSCDKFSQIAAKKVVDVEISQHPFVDNAIPRLAVVRNIVDGVANPFVIGYAAYHRYELMFRETYVQAVKRCKLQLKLEQETRSNL